MKLVIDPQTLTIADAVWLAIWFSPVDRLENQLPTSIAEPETEMLALDEVTDPPILYVFEPTTVTNGLLLPGEVPADVRVSPPYTMGNSSTVNTLI